MLNKYFIIIMTRSGHCGSHGFVRTFSQFYLAWLCSLQGLNWISAWTNQRLKVKLGWNSASLTSIWAEASKTSEFHLGLSRHGTPIGVNGSCVHGGLAGSWPDGFICYHNSVFVCWKILWHLSLVPKYHNDGCFLNRYITRAVVKPGLTFRLASFSQLLYDFSGGMPVHFRPQFSFVPHDRGLTLLFVFYKLM